MTFPFAQALSLSARTLGGAANLTVLRPSFFCGVGA